MGLAVVLALFFAWLLWDGQKTRKAVRTWAKRYRRRNQTQTPHLRMIRGGRR